MHVTLVHPPSVFTSKSQIGFSQCLGILYIAAKLREKGHRVIIIDALFEGKNNVVQLEDGLFKVGLANKDIIAKIPLETNLIGISIPFSHLAPLTHNLISAVKHMFPCIPLVIGGVYPTTQPEIAMQSEADYIVLGEGEIATCELIDYLINPRSKSIPIGIISKHNFHSFNNTNPVYVKELDTLPFPARDLVPFKYYAVTESQRRRIGFSTASIITSRGCPFDCEFCSVHPVCGYTWRARSPKNVLEEIDRLISDYKINNFEIEDDNFTLNKERAIEILEGIIERNGRKPFQKIYWAAFNGLHINTLDERLMSVIARSNCLEICLGLEHGNREMLRIMNKKLDLSRVVEVIKVVKNFGIPVSVFSIYGYPGETRGRFENAVDFYIKLKKIAPKINFHFFVAQPYPGTKLFDRCAKEGYIEKYTFDNPNTMPMLSTEDVYLIRTPDFDRNELKWRRTVLMKTLTPKTYIKKALKNVLPRKIRPHGIFLYKAMKNLLIRRKLLTLRGNYIFK